MKVTGPSSGRFGGFQGTFYLGVDPKVLEPQTYIKQPFKFEKLTGSLLKIKILLL